MNNKILTQRETHTGTSKNKNKTHNYKVTCAMKWTSQTMWYQRNKPKQTNDMTVKIQAAHYQHEHLSPKIDGNPKHINMECVFWIKLVKWIKTQQNN